MDTNNMPLNEAAQQEDNKKSGFILSIIISIVICLAILVLLAGATMVLLNKDVKRDKEETADAFLHAIIEMDGSKVMGCMFPEAMLKATYDINKDEYQALDPETEFTYEEYKALLEESIAMSLSFQMENISAEIQNVTITNERPYEQQELNEYKAEILGASGVLESDFEISGACEVTVSYGLKETKNSQWEQAEGTLILYESDGCWYVDPNALAGF